MSPSSTRSSTPVTVTVCGTFQSAAVNVRFAAETLPSVVSLEATGMTTSTVGWLVRTTVKLAVPPASVVPRPATGVTVMPASSLSALVTATSAGSIVAKIGSAEAGAPTATLYAMSPSSTASSAPVTMTVCGVFQSAAVNVRLVAETVPSVVSLEATGITTSAVGWLVRTTVKLAVPPASVVPRPATGVTVMPASSLSALVTATSAGSIAAKIGSAEAGAPTTTLYAMSPSSTASSAPVTM